MTRMLRLTVVVVASMDVLVHAQNATITRHDQYNNWAWGSGYELKNDLVTLGVLPDLGGRAIEYSLGTNRFLYHDEYSIESPIPQYPIMMPGGVMTWPTPQDNWTNPSWPPPWSLIQEPYTAAIRHESADSVSVELISRVEQRGAPGLQYRKIYTVYKNSSRVRFEFRLINASSSQQRWSNRVVTQLPVLPSGGEDGKDIWLFFPKGVSALDGTDGYWGAGPNLKPALRTDIVPGIVAMSMEGVSGSLRSHPNEQWTAYVNDRDGYVFVQKGKYVLNGVYPEYGGAVIIVWVGGWLEAELCTPEKNMAPGDSLVFTVDWFAAKLNAPIARVSSAGAVRNRLVVERATNRVSGTFGVFCRGTAKLYFDNAPAPVREYTVDPLTTFAVDETVPVPREASSASLMLFSATGAFVDTLDRAVLDTTSANRPIAQLHAMSRVVAAKGTRLFLSGLALPVAVTIATLDGRSILRKAVVGDETLDLGGLPEGIYLVRVEQPGATVQSGTIVIR